MPQREEEQWSTLLASMPRTHADLVQAINNLKDRRSFLTYVYHHKRDTTPPYERFLIHAANQVIHDDFEKYLDNLTVRASCNKTFTPYEFEACAIKKFNSEFGFDLPEPDHRQFLARTPN
jgi:hypothetical protein